MKINNKSSVFSLLPCMVLAACQTYGVPASAGYRGYWMDTINPNQGYYQPAWQLPMGQGVGMVGKASYYAQQYQGRPTASGEPYNMYDMTAAHRELPFGTLLRVTHLQTGRFVIVRVNDRGPSKPGRIVDVSWAAALELGLVQHGSGDVQVEIVR